MEILSTSYTGSFDRRPSFGFAHSVALTLAFGLVSCSGLKTREQSPQSTSRIEERTQQTPARSGTEPLSSLPVTPAQSKVEAPRKVNLFIGPGLAHSFFAVGAIKALSDQGVKIEHLAGVEWGAVVAVLYGLDGNINDLEWKLLSLKQTCFEQVYRAEKPRSQKWLGKVESLLGTGSSKGDLGDPSCLDSWMIEFWSKRSEKTLADLRVDTSVLVGIGSGPVKLNRFLTESGDGTPFNLSDLMMASYRASAYLAPFRVIGETKSELSPYIENAEWDVSGLDPWFQRDAEIPTIWIESGEDQYSKTGADKAYADLLRKVKLRLSPLRARARIQMKAATGAKAFPWMDFSKRNEHIFDGQRALKNWPKIWERSQSPAQERNRE